MSVLQTFPDTAPAAYTATQGPVSKTSDETKCGCPWIAWSITAALMAMALLCNWNIGPFVDEAQHLHVAWNIGHGKMPYADFFEHHPPLLGYLMAPLVKNCTQVTPLVVHACRLGAFAILMILLLTIYRSWRTELGAPLAPLAPLLFLVIYPYTSSLF